MAHQKTPRISQLVDRLVIALSSYWPTSYRNAFRPPPTTAACRASSRFIASSILSHPSAFCMPADPTGTQQLHILLLTSHSSFHRLYRAPVESDIKSKLPKDPPTRARSSIRRLRRTVGAILHNGMSSAPAARLLARRSGRGLSNPTADSPWTPWDTLEPSDSTTHPRFSWPRSDSTGSYPIPPDPPRQTDPSRPAVQPDPALREVIAPHGMSQEVVRYFGERMARLHAGTSSRTLDDEARGPSGPVDQDPRPWMISSDRPIPPRQVRRLATEPIPT